MKAAKWFGSVAVAWSLALSSIALAADNPCGTRGKLALGVFPRSNPVQTDAMFRPMAERLSKVLGCPVELQTASDFAQFWKGVEAQQYDIVHYNQYHYLRSERAYEVVAHNVEEGRGRIAGALFVRADSGIERLSDLAGKKIIFGGGPDAMMSHIVPRYLLLEAGLGPDKYQWEYAPNPPNAIMAVFYRQADAAGGGDAVIGLPVVRKTIDATQLRAIAQSDPVAHLPWVVKRSLPSPTKSLLKAALLSLPKSDEGLAALKSAGMTGIDSAVDSDYDTCRAMVRKVQAVVPFD
jgi:phosphonate transport system substrate-binding protein